MRFEWDEGKRDANIDKHDIDFADIVVVFEEFTYTALADRFDYGETRYLTFGLYLGEVLAISHTESDDTIRLISARKAEKHEQEKYYANVRD